ncbi:hypothetical protein HNV12_05230 [Methanococcoides sp. SA1]|nr:hypothetical protein [Methanococcoides sp. SA1]
MNRLIIIGNGFDLAHGMKTTYFEFINDHLREVIWRKFTNEKSLIESNCIPKSYNYNDDINYPDILNYIEENNRFHKIDLAYPKIKYIGEKHNFFKKLIKYPRPEDVDLITLAKGFVYLCPQRRQKNFKSLSPELYFNS